MQPDEFSSRLLAGESILWTGQPQQGLLFTSRDVLLIPFSVLWGGFAIFWESAVLFPRTIVRTVRPHASPPIIFPIVGLAFMLVGLFFIFGRFIVDAFIRRCMEYAVTNRRVLIIRSDPMNKFVSLNLERLPGLALSEGRSGRGTITFCETGSFWPRRGFSSWIPSLDPTPRFLSIENARAVFDQIQGQIRQPTPTEHGS